MLRVSLFLSAQILTALAGLLAIFWVNTRQKRHQRQTESELKDRDVLLNAVLEGGGHGIVIVNQYGIVTSFNRASERIMGYEASCFIGKNIGKMIRKIHLPSELEEEAKRLSEKFKRHVNINDVFYLPFEKQDTYERVWTIVRADGAQIPVALTLTVFRNPEGNPCGNLAIFQDISERKKVESLKNDFISTVSHELRTPLTSIRGALGLLSSGELTPGKAMELLSIARRNCERLVVLVNDILDSEKINSDHLCLHIVSLDVMEIIQQAIEVNQVYGDRYNIQFIRKGDCPGAHVMADPDRLMQILANLFSNAAKFSPAGSEVWVSAECDNGRVRFRVRDFGPGIPKDFQGKIFEKFVQADPSDARAYSGSGLGLNICKKLVEAMDGSFGFETEPGTGTRFIFDLPATREESACLPPENLKQQLATSLVS